MSDKSSGMVKEIQTLIRKKANALASLKYPCRPELSRKGYFIVNAMAEPYRDGFLDCAKIMMPMIEALEFECGNRCAHQNPCSAREALEKFKKGLGEL